MSASCRSRRSRHDVTDPSDTSVATWSLLFGVRRSVPCHMRRQRFVDDLERASAMALLLAGSSTVVALLASVDKRLVRGRGRYRRRWRERDDRHAGRVGTAGRGGALESAGPSVFPPSPPSAIGRSRPDRGVQLSMRRARGGGDAPSVPREPNPVAAAGNGTRFARLPVRCISLRLRKHATFTQRVLRHQMTSSVRPPQPPQSPQHDPR